MVKKIVKMPIPEEISDKGGAMVRFVDQTTIPLETTVRDAIEGLFVIGQEALVKSNFFGLFRSMAAGVSRDAKPRKLADFLIIMPVIKGPIDLDKGFDPEVNEIRIVARLLNEMEIDITNWTFEDVTPGRKSFTLESIKAGHEIGTVIAGEAIAINGRNFPNIADLRVEVSLEDGVKHLIAPEYVSGDVSRIDIAAEALSGLETYESESITFTLRGNFAKATKTAKLVSVAPKGEPKIASMIGEKSAKDGVVFNWEDPSVITLENASTEGAKVRRVLYDADGDVMADTGWDMEHCTLDIVSPTVMKFTANANGTKEPSAIWANIDNQYDTRSEVEVMLLNGTILKAPLTFESED